MAKSKVRRVIRKQKLTRTEPFEEQLWPIQLALVLLGGFLIGLILAYLRFNDLRWWANAITWLILTPIVIGAMMILARFVDRRFMRRAVQFSLAVCLLLHLVLGVVMFESTIFSKVFPENREVRDVVHRRTVLPDYHHFTNPQERRQQDFLRPVETETPEPEQAQELQQEPLEETRPFERVQPQPQPVPEPELTVKPAEVEQRRPSETLPRISQQQSQLSRQTTQTAPQAIAQAVASPATTPAASQQSKAPQPRPTLVQRQAAETSPQRRTVDQTPTTSQEASQVQLARRETQPSPIPETTATPTLERRINEPQLAPRSEMEPAPQIAAAQPNQPQDVQPSRVAVTRQTASPTPVEPTSVPTPEAPSVTAAQVQRRQVDSPTAPVVAQAPASQPQQRTATQARPEVAVAAETPTPSRTPQPTPSTPSITPQTSPIPRQTIETVVQRTTPHETPAPAVAQQATPTPLARRETHQSPSPAVNTSATQPVQRQSTQQVAVANTQAQPMNAPGAPSTTPAPVPQPSNTAIAQQTTSAPQAAPSVREPTTTTSTTLDSPANTQTMTRRLPAETAPTIAQTPTPTPNQRRSLETLPDVATSATPAPSVAPTSSSTPAEPRPAASTVARQATSGPTVTQHSLPLETPANSSLRQTARPSPTRAQTAAVPTTNPAASPTASPARASRTATVAVSPTPVESPALAEATQSSRQPSLQPAQMALSRGETGVAGLGASVNLDRAAPTSAGASAVASASATRATSRSANSGPELSPNAPALVARANAGDQAPSATLQATDVPLPNTLGADQPAEINASSSAALARSDSQAESSPVSAAAGTVEVDVGPTRIVATEGVSRAAGGGQPELNSEQQSRLTARSAATGAPEVALASVDISDMAAAPEGAGGGEPPRPNPQLDALAAVSASLGGGEPISGGPSTAIETGPTSEVSGATSVSPTQIARAETLEALPGAAQAGGGAGDPSNESLPAQRARSATGGSPEMAAPLAEMLAASPSSPGNNTPTEEEEDEDERLTSLAAAGGTAGPADSSDAPAASGPIGAALEGPASEPSDAAMAGAAQVARAEMAAAAPGVPEAGGGSLSRTRSSAGPQFAAPQADTPTLAGAPESGGEPNVPSLAASVGDLNAPVAGGVLAQAVTGSMGAVEGPAAVDAPRPGQAGPQLGRRAASSATADGPLLADTSNLGAIGRREMRVALAGGVDADAAPVVSSGAPTVDNAAPDMAAVVGSLDTMSDMDMSQWAFEAARGARPVNVPTPEGPGGLGETLTSDAGLANRRGHSDAETIHFRDARFVRREVGGTPAVNLTAVAPTEAFAQRLRPKNEGEQSGGGGLPPMTEEAIEAGLAFLAKHQMPDGSWSFANFGRGRPGYENETATLESDTAATGLALLAFQGGGYTHQHGKYKDTVRKALEFLVRHQKPDGDFYIRTGGPSDAAMWLYSHGVASIAMAEAYGMTQDPSLREPAQKAMDFIIASQHKSRGGWRYSPNYDSDTSVTGWMMMALKSGELAGLDVPSETFRNVEKWLDSAQKSPTERHLYVYNPLAPDTPQQRHGRRPNPTMTSVGLLMRLYTGWKRDNVHLVAGAEYLLSHPPAIGTRREPQRDAYYWYYATQVLFHMGGDYWRTWNEQLHPMLIESQEKTGPMAGSWNPRTPVPDRWGPHCGRLYVTTLNLLSLEVYYRHLPLYVETAK